MRLDLNPGIVIAFAVFVVLLVLVVRTWQRIAGRYGGAPLLVASISAWAGFLLLAVIGLFALLASGG